MKKMTIRDLKGRLRPCYGLALAAALAVGLPNAARAQDDISDMKGATHMLKLQGIKTTAEAEALKPGDTIAMVCSKCKSVMIHNVTTEKGHIKIMTVGEKHLCPGCDSFIKVIAAGKHGRKNEVKHVCEKCGSSSVFCCATKPGSGSTAGMEEKK
ncbi:MAG TPA: hypothetical protein VG146_12590 [Verrucomicrobiae bacterium]|nr:hypothetical protein [Verrucomicrobiae bacterium]